MAKLDIGTLLVTTGLVGIGGVAIYLALQKKDGGAAPPLDLQGIIDYITNLFKGGAGNGNGEPLPDGNGDGDGGGPKIVPSASAVKRGTSISIQATGFDANEQIDFVAKKGSTEVSEKDNKAADATGAAKLGSLKFYANAATGTATITAKGRTSGKTATASITVTSTTPPPSPPPSGNGNGNGNGQAPPPPPPGTGTGSIVFGVAGDWGSGRNNNWQKTVSAMKSAKVQVMLGTGDYSYTSTGDWKKVTDSLKSAQIMSKGAEGNHDGSGYAGTFTNQSSMLFTFTAGPACVIALNTENGASGNVAFAEKTLKATTKPWKILIMHKCLYTGNSDHGAESSLANALKPIILKYGVQLAMFAHNHNYQRIVRSDQPKCTFLCTGTGGESHYSIGGATSGTKYTNDNDFGFTKISISGSKLTGQFITQGGSVKDSWTQTLSTSSAQLAEVMLAQRISI